MLHWNLPANGMAFSIIGFIENEQSSGLVDSIGGLG